MNDLDKKTKDILSLEFENIVAGLTGVASSKREDLFLSIGRVLQKLRGGKFLNQLMIEWEVLVKKGKIKEDYASAEEHQFCLGELLDYLDKNQPEEITFNLLKKIFLVSSTKNVEKSDSHLSQQYLKICKTLSSAEILILQACYEIAVRRKEEFEGGTVSASIWFTKIVDVSKLAHVELVIMNESKLLDKMLLTERVYSDKSGVNLKPYFRLTPLGYAICSHIEEYEIICEEIDRK